MLLNQGAVFSREVGKETSPEAPPSGEKAEQRFFFFYLFIFVRCKYSPTFNISTNMRGN